MSEEAPLLRRVRRCGPGRAFYEFAYVDGSVGTVILSKQEAAEAELPDSWLRRFIAAEIIPTQPRHWFLA